MSDANLQMGDGKSGESGKGISQTDPSTTNTLYPIGTACCVMCGRVTLNSPWARFQCMWVLIGECRARAQGI
jgi:hypothetical protein